MILVTGATGFVGRHLVEELCVRNKRVRCLVRNLDRTLPLKKYDVDFATGDILDLPSLHQAMKGVEAVIHLVGIIVETRGTTFHGVHAEGTQNVVAAAKASGAQRFIHMSALGSREGARSRYHQTKWLGEQAVIHSGLPYVIFRPSIIVGPGDGFTTQMANLLRLAPITPIIGDGKYRLQPIFIRDVAKCFADAVDNSATTNQIFELGGPQALPFVEILATIARVLGKKRPRIHLPYWFMYPQAWLMEKTLPKPPLNTDQMKMLKEESVCDMTRAQQAFQLNLTPLENALRSFLSSPPLH